MASRASGRSRPWVSEMTPTSIGWHGPPGLSRLGRSGHLLLSVALHRRSLFRDQLPDLRHEFRRRHVFGLFFAAGADVDFAGFGFLVSDHEQEGYFLERVFADFGVHLFIAGIDLDAHADGFELAGDISGVVG